MLNINTIPKPSTVEVMKYMKKWGEYDKYVAHERALGWLFKKYPKNNDLNQVLIKAAAVNDLFSTGILNVYQVANHIYDLNIDDRLDKGDHTLVKDIMRVEMSRGIVINFYSFATKYCSHHKPEVYPICDSYVVKVLWHFKRAHRFFDFYRYEIKDKDYERFNVIFKAFIEHYKLGELPILQIDKYLWLLGKEYFSR